jgi:hypothetical protein
LKRGSVSNAGVTSLRFSGKSILGGESCELKNLGDGSKVLLEGKCSGSITGYGRINPTLSNYRFDIPIQKDNPDYKENPPEFPYNYDMYGTGIVKLNTVDYFTFIMNEAFYSPVNYEPGTWGIPLSEPVFHGAMFGCPIGHWELIDGSWVLIEQGEARITSGSGKFKTFKDRPIHVIRAGDYKGINRDTGEMNLIFTIK